MDSISQKQCRKCNEIKPLTEYYEGRSSCKICVCRRVSEYRTRTGYRPPATEENKQKNRDRVGRWQKQNKQKVKARNRRYYEKHKDVYQAQFHRRRARRLSAQGCCSVEQMRGRIEMFGARCWICHQPYQAMDHVIALTRGGTNWPANMRPICKSCNSRKLDKDWRLFYE